MIKFDSEFPSCLVDLVSVQSHYRKLGTVRRIEAYDCLLTLNRHNTIHTRIILQ